MTSARQRKELDAMITHSLFDLYEEIVLTVARRGASALATLPERFGLAPSQIEAHLDALLGRGLLQLDPAGDYTVAPGWSDLLDHLHFDSLQEA